MKADTSANSQCPICASTDPKAVYMFKDFHVMRCRACGMSWRSNMYTEEKVLKLYCGSDYDHYLYFVYDDNEVKNRTKDRYRNFERALIEIEKRITTGKLLDVACGSGAFLTIAKERGWDVQGLELSPALAHATECNAGVNVLNASFEEAPVRERRTGELRNTQLEFPTLSVSRVGAFRTLRCANDYRHRALGR